MYGFIWRLLCNLLGAFVGLCKEIAPQRGERKTVACCQRGEPKPLQTDIQLNDQHCHFLLLNPICRHSLLL